VEVAGAGGGGDDGHGGHRQAEDDVGPRHRAHFHRTTGSLNRNRTGGMHPPLFLFSLSTDRCTVELAMDGRME
jgi:hypothetical protein